MAVPQMLSTELPYEHKIPLPRERNENVCPQNKLYTNIHSRIIYNDQKVETIHVSIN